ncbi:TPR Domain containing protein [Trypanosoma theileri]|uniref:TPR Domain containing protein n=1 Tax=Trypanosoma theileri TaxID=67003 RepID=A0A1X0NSH2_9TRYP|nr:TPR Domain containing protein [Trypanosoma theileri]ORC87652.1 TPR Domain containing protein [Trypanosoma theileri]
MSRLPRELRERLAREHVEKARGLRTDAAELATPALAHLTRAVALNPLLVPALLPRAHIAARQGRHDVAIADLTLAIQLEEYGLDRRRLAAAYGARGNVYRKVNKIAESIIDFSRAVEVEPDNGTWLYELGVSYSVQGSTTLAQHFFTTALGDKLTGRMSETIRFRALYALGTCKLNVGDINGAMTVLTKGLEIQETHGLHNLLGVAHFTREEYKMALIHFTRALELDGLNSEYHVNIGLCLFQQNVMQDALKHFEDAVLKGPKQAMLHFFRGNATLMLGMYPQSITDMNEAISLDPSRETYHYSKALAFLAQGYNREALAELQIAVKLKPTFHTAWVHAGLLHLLQRQLFDALNCFSKALNLQEEDVLVHECIGLVYCDLKYYDLAADSFTRCITLGPGNPLFYFRRGAALIEHGDIHGAHLDLTKAVLEYNFREPQALHSLSVVLSRLESFSEALEFANEAVSLNSKNYRYLLHRADCLYAVGNYSEVVEVTTTVIQQGYESAELYYLRARSEYALHLYNETASDLLQAASLQPLLHESADFCYALGIAYLYSNQNYRDAEVALTTAIERHPNPPVWFFDERAKVRQRLGDAAGALADLNVVLSVEEDDPSVLLRRSFAHKSLENYMEAARDFEKVKMMDGAKDILTQVSYEKFFAIDQITWDIN